jgi:hypothetical protein
VRSLVTAIETSVYYIRPSAPGRGPALWRIVGSGAPQELVEGVEEVVNWTSVISVSIAVR